MVTKAQKEIKTLKERLERNLNEARSLSDQGRWGESRLMYERIIKEIIETA